MNDDAVELMTEPESRTAPAADDPAAPVRIETSTGGERRRARAEPTRRVRLEHLSAYYGDLHAVRDIDLAFEPSMVTAIIGPSGCGKSTMVRCVNRMHEEIPGARSEGRVMLDDVNLHASSVDVVAVRRAVGMVFQKPNPFPTLSVFDNVAACLRF